MADSRESSSSSVQAGGAATSAGIVFQQQVGALFGACLLAGERVDERLNLGAAVPAWLRFETEAPVDDILVSTSNDGYIAIQAKTKASLSQDLTSPFGKTVSQFVQHWIACRDGDESRGWNRPLDPAHDRLVLAVSADAPATVRVDLLAALRRRAQPGKADFTAAEQRALDTFDSCVAQAWRSVTSEKRPSELLDQLAGLVTVFVFDPSGADVASRVVARQYRVSRAWGDRLKQRRRETGETGPGRPRRFKPRALAGHMEQLRALVTAQPDLTLAALRAALGVSCSVMAVWRALRRLHLTRKKSPVRPRTDAA